MGRGGKWARPGNGTGREREQARFRMVWWARRGMALQEGSRLVHDLHLKKVTEGSYLRPVDFVSLNSRPKVIKKKKKKVTPHIFFQKGGYAEVGLAKMFFREWIYFGGCFPSIHPPFLARDIKACAEGEDLHRRTCCKDKGPIGR